MNQAKFVVVRNADIDPDVSDCNYQVALKINNDFFYVFENVTVDKAYDLATSLNIKNNLLGN